MVGLARINLVASRMVGRGDIITVDGITAGVP